MMKSAIFLFLFFISFLSFSQKTSISGIVIDTTKQGGLKNAVIMVTKLADSTLVSFTRSNEKGEFQINNFPIDTYQVVISYPSFGDKYFLVIASEKNNSFDFGKIILPPKNIELNEVVVYAYKDPIYYKGDTLIYTADSFKVSQNATVEDLIKKLPGMKVNTEGKISFQGKQVDQVLVDGDEFFGSDPTVATRNLNANSIESVQVFDKQKEDGSANDEEALKVLNLKLKEEAKKGYFGKITGASDFTDYHEGEFLANKFNSKQKISVFGLYSNTPRSGFGWNDMFTYGLNDEMNWDGNEDEGFSYYGNESPQGVPKTGKAGVYYSDKYGKNTRINSNYSYGNNELNTASQTLSQYFLPDTNYTVDNMSRSYQRNESQNVKITLIQKIDSLTEIEFTPAYKYAANKKIQTDNTLFFSDENVKIRGTDVSNTSKARSDEVTGFVRLKRDFKKKDRKLYATFNYNLTEQNHESILQTTETFYEIPVVSGNSINQQKINTLNKNSGRVYAKFTEPLNPKIKLNVSYDYFSGVEKQNKNAFDFYDGGYTLLNDSFSNSFENNRTTNIGGIMVDYEVKKRRFYVGSDFRTVTILNNDLISGNKIYQDVKNILPYALYRYKISNSSSFDVQYKTSSSQPSIYQLQPIPDNSNPNNITLGNPDLLPTYRHRFITHYSVHKPITGKNLWTQADYNITNNAFANKTSFDNLGRRITQTVNIPRGNSNGGLYLWANYPLFSKLLQLQPQINGTYRKYVSYINEQENTTRETGITSGLDIIIEMKKITISTGGSYSYNDPRSTISTQSNQPYSSQRYRLTMEVTAPKKIMLKTNAEYNVNSRRSAGYNVDYLIWNISIQKAFLKSENLIASVDATDILNQNINATRTVNDNVIIDNKTTIIGRYILARLVYKFNSNKGKAEDEIF